MKADLRIPIKGYLRNITLDVALARVPYGRQEVATALTVSGPSQEPIFGARHLCRFTVDCRQDFGRRSGINAALRFRGSRRENGFRGSLQADAEGAEQIVQDDRFGEVIVGAEVHAGAEVGTFAFGGEEEEGDLGDGGVGPQFLQNAVAI